MKGKAYRFQGSKRYSQVLYSLLLVTCCFPFISASTALVLGLLFSITIGTPFKDIVTTWHGYLLKASVIGFGFGINIDVLLSAGKENIGITSGFVFGAMAVGLALGVFLKIDKVTALLVSVGTAICGGSAIAAVGSTIKADSDQLSIATGTVFLLNVIALFIFPVMGHWFGLSQEQFGHWAAVAIHDTSSVVGASMKYGEEALKVATISKMLRILWIIPVLIVLMLNSSRNGNRTMKFPLFIVGFIMASCLSSFVPAGERLFADLYAIAKQLMVASLFLIGSSVSIGAIRRVGSKVLIQAVSLWVLVLVVALLVIIYT